MAPPSAEKDTTRVMVCTDCGHQHGGAPHGFCRCGCTYPGWKWCDIPPVSTAEEQS